MKTITRFAKPFSSLLLPLFFAAVNILPAIGRSALSPEATSWQKISTPHFDIVYDAKHKELAEGYAVRAEKAYELLIPIFREAPAKTTILINDSTDLANGYATRIPYPFIMVYPVLPGPLETISEYGDWALELIIHEYTHILSFEPAHAAYDYLRPVFGTVIAPNMLMPRWWLEGVAVEMETRLSEHGRLRSYYQDAALRALVLDGKLDAHRVDQINEVGIPSWPYGARPYLFGSLMWSEITNLKGQESVEKLMQSQGRKVPFIINGPADEVLNDRYSNLFVMVKSNLKARAEKQIAAIESPQKLENVVLKGVETQLPVISPDGLKMVFLSKSEVGQRTIELVQRESKEAPFHLDEKSQSIWIRTLPNDTPTLKPDAPAGGNISRVSWFPDSDRIVYDKASSYDRERVVSDLYMYDFTKKKNKRLTRGERLREPAVDLSGKRLTFVRVEASRNSLGICNMDCETVEIVFVPLLHSRVSFPNFISETEILFSLRDVKGNETLHVFDLVSKDTRPVLQDYPDARFGKITQKGILFSSSKSGVLDLYLAQPDLLGANRASRVQTAAFTADYDNHRNELYMTVMTGEGLQIRRAPLLEDVKFLQKATTTKGRKLETAPPPVISSFKTLYDDRYPATKNENFNVANESEIVARFSQGPYSPWRDLAPKYWIPYLYSTENGVFVQAITSGQDATQEHAYSLQLGYDDYLRRGSFAFSYLNRQTPTYIGVGYVQAQQALLAKELVVEDRVATIIANRELSWIGPEATYGAGWTWRERTVIDGTSSDRSRSGPMVEVSYLDVSQTDAQVSPESGKELSISAVDFLKSQSNLPYRQVTMSGAYYWSKWLPKRHAIGLKAQALYTDGKIPPIYGGSSSGAPISSALVIGNYLMRGYISGEFLGKNLLNTNLEYRFPVYSFYRGFGTSPLFIKRVSGNVFVDQLWLDGVYYDPDVKGYFATKKNESFTSAGAEVRLETTLGYSFPISILLGGYMALSRPTKGDSTVFVGLVL